MLPGLYLRLSTMFQLDLNGMLTEIGVAESSAQPWNPLRKKSKVQSLVSPCFWPGEITLLNFMNQCDARYCHLRIWRKYRNLNYSKWRRKCRRTTKKPLLKRGHLSTTGYPSTTGIFEIMCCVILTSKAIIWYLPPRLSWKHKGLSKKNNIEN